MNVENVVNPPQNPVVNNNLVCGDKPKLGKGRPEKKPIKKHPKRFTMNVPKGNEVATIAAAAFDTKNRQPPPKKLPQPTIKKSRKRYIVIFINVVLIIHIISTEL